MNDLITLIAPNKIKYKLLNEIDKKQELMNIKIISLEELKQNNIFEIKPSAPFFISKKYNIKYEVAVKLLKNVYYIDESDNENMKLLRNIKQDLEDNNLIVKHYKKELNNPYLIGYDILTKEQKTLIGKYKEISSSTYPIKEAYRLKTIEDEVTFVFEKMYELIEKGIPLEKIVLTNITDEYKYPLMNMGKLYNLNINIKENSYYATKAYKDSKEKILSGKNISQTEQNNQLIAKINKLDTYEEQDLPLILDTYAKEIKLDEENDVRIEDLTDNFFLDDEYVFILNATKSNLPRVYKDEDYLYDQIKPDILENTIEKNDLEEKKVINALNKIKNKIITLKETANGSIYLPSSILDNIIDIDINYSNYSKEYNKNKLIELEDRKLKYGEISDITNILENTYEIPYRTYDSTFKGINIDKFYKTINNKMLLSYSSLNDFYECRFKFYLNRVLKISPYKQTFLAYIGSMFHYVLEHMDNNINDSINNFIKENPYDFSEKEKFFKEKLTKDLDIIVSYIKEFEEKTSLKTKLTEQKYYYKIKGKLDITLMGIIDKLYMNSDKFVLVDYKTGDTKINLNNVINGLSMQLPIYALLVSKNEEKELLGFFLQNILETKFNHNDALTVIEQKENSLKLNGYMLDNESDIKDFDPTYMDSKYITGMKIGKSGFYHYTKILSKEKEENLITLAEEKVKDMSKDIENANFDINPKKLKGENISCKFCPFKDICFNQLPEIIIEESIDLSFLGGKL